MKIYKTVLKHLPNDQLVIDPKPYEVTDFMQCLFDSGNKYSGCNIGSLKRPKEKYLRAPSGESIFWLSLESIREPI